LGGLRTLADCTAATGWPTHGIYLFFEPGQARRDGRCRVVRVGTHALSETSKTTLWTRLSQHRGTVGGSNPGSGNHRGSIFRHHVGTALLNSGVWPDAVSRSWRDQQSGAVARRGEVELERAVSACIGRMPLLWLAVSDRHQRTEVEAGLIALLSCRSAGTDLPSATWLGLHADSGQVRTSGLWNVMHVDRPFDPGVLVLLDRLIRDMPRPA
jgi:hypothetical protein